MNSRTFSLWIVGILLVGNGANALDIHKSFSPLSARYVSADRNKVEFDSEKNEYVFSYQDDEFNLVYAINSRDTNVMRGMISLRVTVNEKDRIVPIYQGGTIIKDGNGQVWLPNDTQNGRAIKLTSNVLQGEKAVFQYEEKVNNQVLHKGYQFSIRGKTLIMEATGDISNATTAYYAGFDLGKSRLTTDPIVYTLPSVSLPVVYIGNKYFMSTYADPLLSTAGQYEMTENIIRSRSIQASNTPAWLLEDNQGHHPPFEITSYLTISNRILDVIPSSAPKKTSGKEIRNKVILDLHQLPFKQRPSHSVETIRRWDVLQSGLVFLEGTFQLHEGDSASCSVLLYEARSGKERVLFSQILDLENKSAAGMKGNFPVKQGDQILFTISGPAIMDGGNVLIDARLEHEGAQYSSYGDFSSEQGVKGWYYEQRIGNDRSLMVWNPEGGQWESPFTRSLQTAVSMICRSGAAGNAFDSAKQFFQELRWLGLTDLAFLVRDWPGHARFAPPPDSHHSEYVWGSANDLLAFSQDETGRGNMLVPIVGAEQLGLPSAENGLSGMSLMQLPGLLGGGLFDTAEKVLREYIAGVDQKMHRSGVWLEGPTGINRIKIPGLYYQLMGISEPSSLAAREFVTGRTARMEDFTSSPVLMNWRDLDVRFDLYGRSLPDGIASPLRQESNALNLVDEELREGRRHVRIGFGTYEGFYQSGNSDSSIDPRLFPLDQYMTSLLAYGRLPFFSGKVWFPGLNGRDIRRYLLETISLVQPVSREYLLPGNEVKQILYLTSVGPGQPMEIEEIIEKDIAGKINRIRIEYENGLRVFANRSDETWIVHEENAPSVQIAKDGFFAFNPSTGLQVLIGTYGEQKFSVRRSPDSFFLHSRGGGLVRYESFSTDGMVHRWKNPLSQHSDMACLAVTELNRINPMVPLLRSNRRVDCCVEWKSNLQADIHILDTDESPVLLEFFDLPQEWFESKGEKLSITRTRDDGVDPQDPPVWYLTSTMNMPGVRFIDVRPGERYSIQFSNEKLDTEKSDAK